MEETKKEETPKVEDEFKELPKRVIESQKIWIALFYNNRFYRHLLAREELSQKRTLENNGLQVADKTKFEKYLSSNAKWTFWVLIGIGIFIIYAIIKPWRGV